MAWRVTRAYGLAGHKSAADIARESAHMFRSLSKYMFFRSMPTANVEGCIESEGSPGKVFVGRALRYPQIDTGPRRLPSACSETLRKSATDIARESVHLSNYMPDQISVS